jgi:O-antigen/teichoic acid export membrane protein
VQLLLILLLRPDLRWVYRPTLHRLREVFTFGSSSALAGLLLALNEFLPNVYLGRLLGLDALGHFNRAFVMFSLPDKLLLTGFVPVALPAFTALARDGRDLKAAYLRALDILSAVKMPVHILLAILAAPATRLLLGPKWDGVVPLLQIMSASAIFSYPFALSWPVLVAGGAVHLYVRALLIGWPIAVSAMFIAAHISLQSVAWAWGIAGMAYSLPWFYMLKKVVGASWAEVLAHLKTTLVITAISMALPFAAYLAFDPISVPLSFAVGVVALIGWLIGIRVTRHPLLAEVNRAFDAALRIALVRRLADRLPGRLRSCLAYSSGRTED